MQHALSKVKVCSMRLLLTLLILLGISRFGYGSPPDVEPKLPDYELLTHHVRLESFRAGNHNPKGSDVYFFRFTLQGLLADKDEETLEFAKRKKIEKILADTWNLS